MLCMTCKFLMFRNKYLAGVLILLLPLQVWAASSTLPPEMLRDLSDKNAQIKAKVKELDEISRKLVAAKALKRSSADSIERLEEESAAALAKLEKLQEIDRDEPDAIPPEKLTAAKEANRKAKAALRVATENRDEAASELRALNNSATEQYEEFKRLENSFERDVDTAVSTQVDRQIRAMQASKEVTVTVRTACGEDDSRKECKEKSLNAAEREASEKGSVVFVNSFTEIKNFKLSKDEVRSEVRATLSNKDVVQNVSVTGETLVVETILKARVEPVLGDNLRDQMSEGVRAEIYAAVGGKIDYDQVRNPVSNEDSEVPVKRKIKTKVDPDSKEAKRAARAEEERRRLEEARAAAEERRAAAAAEERRRIYEAQQRAEQERRAAEMEKRKAAVPTFSF